MTRPKSFSTKARPERPVTLRFSCTSRITLRRSDASDAARAALAKSLQLDMALATRDDVKKLRAQLGAR